MAAKKAVKKRAKNKPSFETLKRGTKVHWAYRGAIGHGTVIGIETLGTNAGNTRYRVRETDHHPGEKNILVHTGKALKKG